jgi:hypothetical protein
MARRGGPAANSVRMSRAHSASDAIPAMTKIPAPPHGPRFAEIGLLPGVRMRQLLLAFAVSLITAPADLYAQGVPASTQLKSMDRAGRELAQRRCTQGKIIKRDSRVNPHEPAFTDEILRFQCPGFTAEIYRAHATNPPRDLPLEVQLSVQHPEVPASLGVGTPVATLRRILGKPFHETGSAITYSLSDERPDQDAVSFVVVNGVVSAVIWSWAVD